LKPIDRVIFKKKETKIRVLRIVSQQMTRTTDISHYVTFKNASIYIKIYIKLYIKSLSKSFFMFLQTMNFV